VVARIVGKNSELCICKENVDIEHRSFLSGTDKGGISLLASYMCN